MSRWRGVLPIVVAGVGLLLGMHPSGPSGRVDRPAPVLGDEAGRGGGAGAGGGALVAAAGRLVDPAVALAGTSAQADPERLDPALGRAHRRVLGERPVFQHLPYRDREIGVNFDRVVGGGRLELLVTYVGSRPRAVGDLRRLLARYGDPGTAYVERYERVF